MSGDKHPTPTLTLRSLDSRLLTLPSTWIVTRDPGEDWDALLPRMLAEQGWMTLLLRVGGTVLLELTSIGVKMASSQDLGGVEVAMPTTEW